MSGTVITRRLTGYDVAVREWGTGGPTVVLVHGIGVSHRYFAPLARLLGDSCRVLAPDLPGFGASAGPAEVLTIEQHAEVVADLLEQVGGPSTVLVGHSMGAQVVTEAAVRDPGLAERVVLIGPVIQPGHRYFPEQAGRLLRDARYERATANAIMFADWVRCGPRRYLGTVPSMLGYPLEDRLPLVTAPVVLVRGAKDTVAPRDYLDLLADRAQQGSVVQIEDAAHVVMYSRPALVAEVCRGVRC
ncbi:MAG TPA: alpha/beta hydrolase [Actinotalea sp.]